MEKIGKAHRSLRDLACCGLFGAALFLAALFHLLRLGNVFMPMCLPTIALACFVAPLPAAIRALIVPILSGAPSPPARVDGKSWIGRLRGLPGWQ